MSAFEKIVGMFPSREIGEKVAQEILEEHTDELITRATLHMGPEASPHESAFVARYVQGWYGALDFIKDGTSNTSFRDASVQIGYTTDDRD